jgi:antitoxin component YwqK of YwqJK toxin-antitoxin module
MRKFIESKEKEIKQLLMAKKNYINKAFLILLSFFLINCKDSNSDYSIENEKQPNCSDIKNGLKTLNDKVEEIPLGYTGIVYSCRNEKVVVLHNYKNGKRDGLYKAWYENGQLSHELYFKLDMPDHLCRSWYENGKLKYEKKFKDGVLDGLFREWYENGQLQQENNYVMGKPEGLQRLWYENGELAKELYYKNGKAAKLLDNDVILEEPVSFNRNYFNEKEINFIQTQFISKWCAIEFKELISENNIGSKFDASRKGKEITLRAMQIYDGNPDGPNITFDAATKIYYAGELDDNPKDLEIIFTVGKSWGNHRWPELYCLRIDKNNPISLNKINFKLPENSAPHFKLFPPDLNSNSVKIEFNVYKSDDADCCPSGGTIVRNYYLYGNTLRS